MKYSLKEIANIVGGKLTGCDRAIDAISTDSRSMPSGNGVLFVAINGANSDSHLFIDQMSSRGVRSFIIEREAEYRPDHSYIKVGNSIEALQRWAAHHRQTFKGRVVAITGSNGKTTVKEWFAQSIPSNIKLFRSPRSYNSQLGVALSLLMIEGDEDIALIEAGISKTGEMERLEEMIQPEIVVFTSIGEAHQSGFTSLEQKIEQKLILARRAERIIYHSAYESLTDAILYLNIEKIDSSKFESSDQHNQAMRRDAEVVAAMCHTLELPTPDTNNFSNIAMRLEVIEGLSDSMIINDSYNSDLNSLEIALDELRRLGKGRESIVVLSDIRQSGLSREELYSRVNRLLKRSEVAHIYGVGRELQASARLFEMPCTIYPTTEELISRLSAEHYSERAILLKGNRESRFEQIAHALSKQSHTTTLEVNLEAMSENINYLQSHLHKGCKRVAMVKARSYGAGGIEVAKHLQLNNIDYLAVAFADEGAELRRGGVTMPIIVLNADDGSFAQMVDYQLEPEIYSLRSLRSFTRSVEARGERGYPIHIKLDTGMHRLGFMSEDIESLCEELNSLRGVVRVSTIFSHLCAADMGEQGRERTERQIELFEMMSSAIERGIGYKTIRHLANSAAIEHYPNAHFDMVRLGIGLYGFGSDGVTPISKLTTKIVQIRGLRAGESVGYGVTWSAERDSKIATIPIGYADGLDRRLGGEAWSVIIGGSKAPIVGRICMDSCMVDVTDLESVNEGDEVVIFSAESGNRASDISELLGTIPYEILTSISARVKRIYVK
ncbi:MAG: alanine racemase [Rikenellaceae bacterium]